MHKITIGNTLGALPKQKFTMMRQLILFALLAVSLGTQGQTWKDVLSGVKDRIVGTKGTTESTILGTWQYEKADCEFSSDNTLSEIGGAALASKMNTKMTDIAKKYKLDGGEFTFNEDGTFTSKLKGKISKGTYTFNKDKSEIHMQGTYSKKEIVAQVKVVGREMTMLFDTDKLLNGMQALSGITAKYSQTLSTVNSLMKNYKGMKMGFRLKKK